MLRSATFSLPGWSRSLFFRPCSTLRQRGLS
uniref:Uncharacterized protein n=1 Tax=Anguilla anguilla TaxID=7936 RepID=A0A0E9PCM0_ANGAN